ncbi:MAG: IclR family transcriptional regulator [Bacteroidota bacterium]
MEISAFNNSVVKAFQLLEHFTADKPSWGVRELAYELGANKSTTYRLMATLNSLGVLKKDEETEKYSLGLKLFELGHRVDLHSAFIAKTHPVLEEVVAEITETVHLGILKEGQVLMVDRLESPQGLKLNSSIGSYSPAYCTSLGKILLADLDEEAFGSYYEHTEFSSFTQHTIVEKELLEKELHKVRKQGFALDREEKEYGLICLGVPVFNARGEMIAALSAAGPAQRFKSQMLKEYVQILKNGASLIQQKLGSFKP